MRPDYAYQKKNQYLLHPQLIDYQRIGWKEIFSLHVWIFIIIALFIRLYPNSLVSFDLSMTILVLLFWFGIKPLMLKGLIPAYYRRDYNQNVLLWLCKLFIHGSIIRTFIMSIYYGLTLYLTYGKDMREYAHYLRIVKEEIVLNHRPQIVALALFLFLVYVMFYHERYVSIKEFSYEVSRIAREKHKSIWDATREFVYRKDLEFEKQVLDHVKYEKDIPSYVFSGKNKIEEQKVSDKDIFSFNEQEFIRRQSRR